MEHRHGTRYPAEFAVHVNAVSGPLSAPGVLSDVSLSGCFIKTSLPAQPLIRVTVQFISQEYSGALVAEAQVIRQTDTGIGIEWADYQSELVLRLSGDLEANNARRHVRNQVSAGQI